MSTVVEERGCPDCKYTGFIHVQQGGAVGVKSCHCVTDRIARKRQFHAGEGAWPLPENLRQATLKSFLLSGVSTSVRFAFNAAQRYAERPSRGILFAGAPGTGKSHLAAAILQAVNVEAHFVGVPMLMRALRDTFNASGRSETDIIDELVRVPLLVLDDIGAERSNGYAEETLYLIIEQRSAAKRPLIFTTNKLVSETSGPAQLQEYLSERTHSRVKGLCWNNDTGQLNFFQMQGADRRYGKHQ
jgi:DNA replication protein DnaC